MNFWVQKGFTKVTAIQTRNHSLGRTIPWVELGANSRGMWNSNLDTVFIAAFGHLTLSHWLLNECYIHSLLRVSHPFFLTFLILEKSTQSGLSGMVGIKTLALVLLVVQNASLVLTMRSARTQEGEKFSNTAAVFVCECLKGSINFSCLKLLLSQTNPNTTYRDRPHMVAIIFMTGKNKLVIMISMGT